MTSGVQFLFTQRFEGQDLQHLKKGTSSAETTVLSFWVRSAKSGTHIVELFDTDNSRHINKAYTVSSADTWEHKEITIEGDTTGAFTNDVNTSLEVTWHLAAGSNFTSGTLQTSWGSRTDANRAVGQVNVLDSTDNNFYLTGIQWEIGSQATPFEQRSFGEELALCQRYFYNHVSNSTGAIVGNGDFFSASQTTCLINFPVSMRATPSMITENGGTNYYSIYSASVEHTASNAWNLFLPQVNCANLYITPNSNGTSGNATRVRTNNASAFIYFDSEL